MKMTSVFPEEETKIAKMKQKLMNDVHGKEETRSFPTFSRENLSISHSDLEQGFNKHRFRPNRNTILSVTALVIALLCLGLETWRLHCSLANTHDIEELKRDIESLKHRFLEEDLLDKLKAFEEQLYAEVSNDDDDPGEADIGNAEYDSYYDDISSHDFSSDHHAPPIYGARPSDFPDSSSTIAPVPSPPEPKDDDMTELLAAIRKNDQEYKKSSRESQRNAERFIEELKKVYEEKSAQQKNNTKHKRDAEHVNRLFEEWRTSLKEKRSIDDDQDSSKRTVYDRHSHRNQSSKVKAHAEEKTAEEEINTSIAVRRGRPPKKYYDRPSSDPVHSQTAKGKLKKSARKLRRNMNTNGGLHAVHYNAVSSEQFAKGTYDANGRFQHYDRLFSAWKPSNWVTEFDANQNFNLTNGMLQVKSRGLYLVYAQIHYKDEHHQQGFHLKVNGRPVMQCMIYNPSNRSNSQSCFSSQLIYLQSNDVLVLEEVGSPRYALLHEEKSFFGLVKL